MMNDFNLWLQEMGYAQWNDLTNTFDYNVDTSDPAIWDDYMAQRGSHAEEQLVLFDDDDDDICDESTVHGVVWDDDDDGDWVRGTDDTMPLFDDDGGLTAEAYAMLHDMEQDGGFT